MKIFIDNKSQEKLTHLLSKKTKPYAVKIRVLKVG